MPLGSNAWNCYAKTFVAALQEAINAQLISHFNVVVRAKLGRILLPNMTRLYINVIAFQLPHVSQHISLVENMDAAMSINI